MYVIIGGRDYSANSDCFVARARMERNQNFKAIEHWKSTATHQISKVNEQTLSEYVISIYVACKVLFPLAV